MSIKQGNNIGDYILGFSASLVSDIIGLTAFRSLAEALIISLICGTANFYWQRYLRRRSDVK